MIKDKQLKLRLKRNKERRIQRENREIKRKEKREKRDKNEKKIKIALLFFGITRSLKYTIGSIKTNIFNVFEENDVIYDIFMHTYSLDNYVNTRTGEISNDVDNNEYKLLNPDYIQVDSQEIIKKKINPKLYRTWVDVYKSNYLCVDNLLLGHYSKLQLVKMVEKSKKIYNYIIFLRPDVQYLNRFNMNFINYVSNQTICIPNFHLYHLGIHSKWRKISSNEIWDGSGRGEGTESKFNDRFCITNMKTYKIYGNTFKKILDISKKMPLHSESIIYNIISSYDLKFVKIPFIFKRIRYNGQVARQDRKLHLKLTILDN